MLSRKTSLLSIFTKHRQLTRTAAATVAHETPQKWDLLCGVCLERKPILARPLNKMEIAIQKVFADIELENSKKSEHEMRHLNDLRRAEEFKSGNISTEDIEKSLGQTAIEFEDASAKEGAEFVAQSRVTKADEENDVKSTDRCLDRHLLYVINEKIGSTEKWILPHDTLRKEENLRSAAERIVAEKCGRTVRAKFLSNAPCGFYKYRYPKEVTEKSKSTGAKIFFMKAQYLGGDVEAKEYNWATRDELPTKFADPYYHAVDLFLLKDEPVELE